MPFESKTILLKSADQEIRGNIRIQNKRLSDNKIQSLTINEADLSIINGVDVKQFFQNLVRLNQQNTTTYSHLTFMEPVVVGSFHSRGQWNGVNVHGVVDRLGQSMANTINYTDPLEMYHQVGVALVKDIKSELLIIMLE